MSATTGTVFDESTLTGEFSSFIDNWDMVSAPVLSVSGDKGTMIVKSSSVIGSTGAGTVKGFVATLYGPANMTATSQGGSPYRGAVLFVVIQLVNDNKSLE